MIKLFGSFCDMVLWSIVFEPFCGLTIGGGGGGSTCASLVDALGPLRDFPRLFNLMHSN